MIKHLMTLYTVPFRNEPGALAKAAHVLGKDRINITAVTAETVGEMVLFRFLADRENMTVRRSLQQAGYPSVESPVLVVELPNHPDELSRLAKVLSEEKIGILGLFGAPDGARSGRLILCLDQPEEAAAALDRLGQKAHAAA